MILQSIKGTVAVLIGSETLEKSAVENMKVQEGDTVLTKSKSSLILKFEDGSMAKIGPLSKIKIDKSQSSGQQKQISLAVDSGKVWTRVGKLGTDSGFVVKTPTAIAAVRGTYYSSEVEQDASSRFNVFDGEIAVSSVNNPGQQVMVKKNQSTSVAAGKAPEAPKEIPKEELEKEKGGFSENEYTAASFEIRVSINPPEITSGQKATVTIQVFKDGSPTSEKASLKVKLGGSATFTQNNSNQIDIDTDNSGVASLEITGATAEIVNVDVRMTARVKKKK
ncbi:MAG: FecR domain-containing protein [bacterium]